jgi:6-pyruvoyl-tetrahydropterin synthase
MPLDIPLIKKLVNEMLDEVDSGTFNDHSDNYKYLQDNTPNIYETIKDKVLNSREMLEFMFDKMESIKNGDKTYEETCTEVYTKLNNEYIAPLDTEN